jgi:hypothetical protein
MSRKKTKKTNKQKVGTNPQAPPQKTTKFSLVFLAVGLIAIIGIGYFAMRGNQAGYVNAKDTTFEKKSNIETSQAAPSNLADDPDFIKLKGGETKPVISPARFRGNTASSYKVAWENPDLLDAMYCYCYCKRTIGHKSLLSCFTDRHASKCDICQDQAFYAKILQDRGLDIGQIRKEVDRKFWRPFS